MKYLYIWTREYCEEKGFFVYDNEEVKRFKNSNVEYINNDNEILTPDDYKFEIICTAFELENDPLAMKIYSTMRLDIIDCFTDELLIF